MSLSFPQRLSLSAIAAVTAIFAVVMALAYVFVSQKLTADATERMQSEVEHAGTVICDRLDAAEIAIINAPTPTKESDRFAILHHILENNPDVSGCCIALKQDVVKRWNGRDFYMLYAYRDAWGRDILTKELGDSTDYNYTQMEWFTEPMRTETNHWSEPYYDKGAGEMLMCTFSHPFRGERGDIVGVLTADIALNKGMAEIVSQFDVQSAGRAFLLSPKRNLVFGDTIGIAADDLVFTSHLKDTQWVYGRTISRSELFAPLYSIMLYILCAFIFTLLIICASIYYTIHRLSRPEVKRQMRIETELNVAQRIQEGMLPKMIPPFPDRSDIDIRAIMHPAKEVGGDFYNYFLEDNRLYFIIADVSGKGIPAALVMAIATELFIVSAPGQTDASVIVERINRQLCRDNQAGMFVTMIVGILDINRQELQLCNAGHNLPYILTPGESKPQKIDLPPNLVTGIMDGIPFETVTMPFAPNQRLVLYTDGVTEAENNRKELFGEERLEQVLAQHPADIRDAITSAIDRFAEGVEQSDDVTVMTIESRSPQKSLSPNPSP